MVGVERIRGRGVGDEVRGDRVGLCRVVGRKVGLIYC